MNRPIIFCLATIITMGLAGCAQYEENAMAGDAVDIPDPTPLSQETPMLTAPSPTPSSADTNGRQVPGQ